MKIPSTILAFALLFVLTSTSQAGQRFLMKVPGKPELAAKVIKTPQTLRVNNRGNFCKYVRDTTSDSPNGRFQGYYCAQFDRLIRWPVGGQGPVLRYMNGSWRVTDMQLTRVQ